MVEPATLGSKQRRVAAGMASGLVLSAATVVLGPGLLSGVRAEWLAALCCVLPASSLAFAVARLARHRFFHAEDIDGSGLSAGSDRARMLQALIQNTLEQCVIAFPAYAAGLFAWPDSVGRSAAACAGAFFVGRILFFARYGRGAPARALGFALTFYPTVMLLAWEAVLLVGALASARHA
jgi:hypothetical protein